ncbi:MAG TPA: aminotransferase class III-fold pyridoxal phosphate-dependent enzyme, partial [Deltaproteobacteria bacterium]|nr:aminotransferase class III-fold pyridoxal phosphate-dependent enzyme [Deltaproteobacteria bacterium]
NPLAMSAALATLQIMLEENILENTRKVGEYFLAQLKKLKDKHKVIKEVRGKGLMLAASLEVEAAEIVQKCMQKGMLINSAGAKTLRFVPPLIINNNDVDRAILILNEVMEGK